MLGHAYHNSHDKRGQKPANAATTDPTVKVGEKNTVGPKTFLKNFFSRRKTKVPQRTNGWMSRHIHDPDLWHFGRRSVAGGVGVGLFLSFIPIPIQMLLAIPFSVVLRVNLPITLTAIWATNPITFAPMFIFAYKVGTWLTGEHGPTDGIPFTPSFEGLAATLDVIWYPLLVGCFACGITVGIIGNLLVRAAWRGYLVYTRRRRLRS